MLATQPDGLMRKAAEHVSSLLTHFEKEDMSSQGDEIDGKLHCSSGFF